MSKVFLFDGRGKRVDKMIIVGCLLEDIGQIGYQFGF